MVDERELHDLLHQAAPDELPPARFDHAAVVAVSRDQRHRRRRVLAGLATSVVVLTAGGGAVALVGRAGVGADESAASAAVSATQGGGGVEPQRRPPDRLPEDPAPRTLIPGPAPAAGSCGPADRSVYSALIVVFPDLAAQEPFPLERECPAGVTGAGVVVRADGVVGRLEVLLGPVVAQPGQAQVSTDDGRVVTVVSVPAAGAPLGPYAGSLPDVAQRVAAALG